MEENERIEYSKYVLSRFDHYIEGANSKGNFLLAFSVFLCGFIITSYNEIVAFQELKKDILTSNLLIIVLICGILSIALTIAAVYPYFKSGNSSSKKYYSLIFFKSIADMETEKLFLREFKKQDKKKVCKDLSKQIYAISLGLKKKYSMLRWAMRLIFVQLFILLIIIIIKVI